MGEESLVWRHLIRGLRARYFREAVWELLTISTTANL
jgi:hypothetical protein